MKKYELVQIIKLQCREFNGKVYDLQVQDDHSYNIEGIIVHNCTTKNKTGFHVPMVTSVSDCYQAVRSLAEANFDKQIPIIADGGIEQHGDIAKALALGAKMVMAGSLFSGYDQSAGDIIQVNNIMYKQYYGSASQHNKGQYKNVQGKKILIPYKGNMDKLIIELKQDLQSSISYAGGNKVEDLQYTNMIRI